MIRNNVYQVDNNTLTKISLLCTILALDVSNPLFQNMVNSKEGDNIMYKYQLTDILLNYHPTLQSNTALQEIALLLVQTLNVTLKHKEMSIQKCNEELEIERLKQYLRKFTFFFQAYIRKYPNQLSVLSSKKTNMLAVQNLFLISGL